MPSRATRNMRGSSRSICAITRATGECSDKLTVSVAGKFRVSVAERTCVVAIKRRPQPIQIELHQRCVWRQSQRLHEPLLIQHAVRDQHHLPQRVPLAPRLKTALGAPRNAEAI